MFNMYIRVETLEVEGCVMYMNIGDNEETLDVRT